eukprot:1099423-Rhodomonas_salina.4
MEGLFKQGCFRKHYYSSLSREQCQHVYGSRFHHKINCSPKTGVPTFFKKRLVIMGNRMQKGEDYVEAFSPVPCSTAARVMMSIAAALDLEIHSCDFLQAFIQASWADLPEKVPEFFIRPPSG